VQRASGRVTEYVKAKPTEAGGIAGAFEATSHGRPVQPSSQPRAEHVVVALGVVAARGQAPEGVGRRIGERNETRLPTLGGALDAGGHGALHDDPSRVDVDVLPAQRQELAEARGGERSDAKELRVLRVLTRPPLDLTGVEI
jgi:hypothetical protein